MAKRVTVALTEYIGFQHLVMEHQSVQKLMFELRPGSFFTKKFSIE